MPPYSNWFVDYETGHVLFKWCPIAADKKKNELFEKFRVRLINV